MTDNVLLSIEDNSPAALQVFTSVCRRVIYVTTNIWVGAPKFIHDGKTVIADVMFSDPSEPEYETGMWFAMDTRELLNDEFWTLVMNAQHALEKMRDEHADWSKHPATIELPRHMWTEEARNANPQ